MPKYGRIEAQLRQMGMLRAGAPTGLAPRTGDGTADPTVPISDIQGLRFWCGNDRLHLEKPGAYHAERCCFKHMIGLSVHPSTRAEQVPTPYQLEFIDEVASARALGPDGRIDLASPALRLAHKYHVNKGRQMGMTEIVLDATAWLCMTYYPALAASNSGRGGGTKVAFMAGTNGQLAYKNLRRFARLFANQPGWVSQWVKRHTMVLSTGIIIEAFPASEEAITGDTQYKIVFMDESAKWKLVDDAPVFNSVMPVVNTNGAYLFVISTPKGPVKMFYDIWKNPRDFIKLEYLMPRTVGNMYTQAEVDALVANSIEDPQQEYYGKFTYGKDAVFGDVEDSERDDFAEWDVELPPPAGTENDAYKEPNDMNDMSDDAEWRPGGGGGEAAP